ncbi:hypothetical protein B0H16DRAFT_1849335 [Mycena metata]|uniref:Uncharacterized protein n=1 Tax=Mycena metata TaxID=1033252 RepID=A0AAD7ITC6_9AGAR|nr:hypothetical protein B0H16DRAFT_1849335 [Mycena metata]
MNVRFCSCCFGFAENGFFFGRCIRVNNAHARYTLHLWARGGTCIRCVHILLASCILGYIGAVLVSRTARVLQENEYKNSAVDTIEMVGITRSTYTTTLSSPSSPTPALTNPQGLQSPSALVAHRTVSLFLPSSLFLLLSLVIPFVLCFPFFSCCSSSPLIKRSGAGVRMYVYPHCPGSWCRLGRGARCDAAVREDAIETRVDRLGRDAMRRTGAVETRYGGLRRVDAEGRGAVGAVETRVDRLGGPPCDVMRRAPAPWRRDTIRVVSGRRCRRARARARWTRKGEAMGGGASEMRIWRIFVWTCGGGARAV